MSKHACNCDHCRDVRHRVLLRDLRGLGDGEPIVARWVHYAATVALLLALGGKVPSWSERLFSVMAWLVTLYWALVAVASYLRRRERRAREVQVTPAKVVTMRAAGDIRAGELVGIVHHVEQNEKGEQVAVVRMGGKPN